MLGVGGGTLETGHKEASSSLRPMLSTTTERACGGSKGGRERRTQKVRSAGSGGPAASDAQVPVAEQRQDSRELACL